MLSQTFSGLPRLVCNFCADSKLDFFFDKTKHDS